MQQGNITLYHGSSEIIEAPTFGKGRPYNDYGLGFYCTESLDLAKEWACPGSTADGFANEYVFDARNLKTLRLTDESHSTLHWLALLLQNRAVDTRSPVAIQAHKYLEENFSIDAQAFDLIIGWRADDSYFSFARAFLQNQISLEQLTQCMRLGELGLQTVIKSKKAFGRLQFKQAIQASASLYHPKRLSRDAKARQDFREISAAAALEGLYMRDILMKKLTPKQVLEYERAL